MKTKTLNTGVVITFDDKDNMLSVVSPYDRTKPHKISYLAYAVEQLKKVIGKNNKTEENLQKLADQAQELDLGYND
jgi:hypothetical protein